MNKILGLARFTIENRDKALQCVDELVKLGKKNPKNKLADYLGISLSTLNRYLDNKDNMLSLQKISMIEENIPKIHVSILTVRYITISVMSKIKGWQKNP